MCFIWMLDSLSSLSLQVDLAAERACKDPKVFFVRSRAEAPWVVFRTSAGALAVWGRHCFDLRAQPLWLFAPCFRPPANCEACNRCRWKRRRMWCTSRTKYPDRNVERSLDRKADSGAALFGWLVSSWKQEKWWCGFVGNRSIFCLFFEYNFLIASNEWLYDA